MLPTGEVIVEEESETTKSRLNVCGASSGGNGGATGATIASFAENRSSGHGGLTSDLCGLSGLAASPTSPTYAASMAALSGGLSPHPSSRACPSFKAPMADPSPINGAAGV